jgi:hypothetical protein
MTTLSKPALTAKDALKRAGEVGATFCDVTFIGVKMSLSEYTNMSAASRSRDSGVWRMATSTLHWLMAPECPYKVYVKTSLACGQPVKLLTVYVMQESDSSESEGFTIKDPSGACSIAGALKVPNAGLDILTVLSSSGSIRQNSLDS